MYKKTSLNTELSGPKYQSCGGWETLGQALDSKIRNGAPSILVILLHISIFIMLPQICFKHKNLNEVSIFMDLIEFI